MAQRHYIVLAGPTVVEITDRVPLEGWEMTEKAEECAVGSGTLWIADPDMDFDVDGLRDYYVLEDTSESTDDVLFGGFVVDPEVSRGEQGGMHYDPVARAWQIQLTDRNGYWNRRVMLGSDCNRPAETDVARIQWLMGTTEAAWIDDDTTYVNTGSTSSMDKVDYRRQYLNQIVDDCLQHTGKNAWVQFRGVSGVHDDYAWYGKDSVTAYTSPLYLTNDPAEMAEEELLDGTSLVWPISDDTKLKRDVSRVYTGVLINYANGTKSVYRTNATSAAVYGRRDHIADYPNVKTKAKAIARANRLLADLAEPDERITTKVVLPAAKATKIRAGMRVQFKATHLPGYESWQYLRVLACTVKPIAAGTKYELSLELQGSGATAGSGVPYTGSAFAGLLLMERAGASEPYDLKGNTTGDLAPSGWFATPTVGSMWTISLTDGITTSVPMTVRVQIAASFATVGNETSTATISLYGSVQGLIGSTTLTKGTSLGYWSDWVTVDVHDVELAAGERVYWETTETGFMTQGWGSLYGSTDMSYLRVGRGTQTWDGGGTIWTGP